MMSPVCVALSSRLSPGDHLRYLQEEPQPRQSQSSCFCCCPWKLWTSPLQAGGFKRGPCWPWCAISFSGQEFCPLLVPTSASWSYDEATCLKVELFRHPSCCGRVRGFLAELVGKLSVAWQLGAWLSSAMCFLEVKWCSKHDCLAF